MYSSTAAFSVLTSCAQELLNWKIDSEERCLQPTVPGLVVFNRHSPINKLTIRACNSQSHSLESAKCFPEQVNLPSGPTVGVVVAVDVGVEVVVGVVLVVGLVVGVDATHP